MDVVWFAEFVRNVSSWRGSMDGDYYTHIMRQVGLTPLLTQQQPSTSSQEVHTQTVEGGASHQVSLNLSAIIIISGWHCSCWKFRTSSSP